MLITGAGGQLGRALAAEFPDAQALTRREWDVTLPPPPGLEPDLVLHAAAWTDVDGAEADPQAAAAVNVGGTANAAELGAPLVYYSSDYVFDGSKGEPVRRVRRAEPGVGLRADEAPRGGGSGTSGPGSCAPRGSSARPARTSCGRCSDSAPSGTRSAVVDDQRGCPTYVGHLAAATKAVLELPFGTYHVAAEGDCTWADFAEAIFEEAGVSCRVRRIATAELPRPATRPAYSVLRSEKGAPTLPHWRDGLRECVARLA